MGSSKMLGGWGSCAYPHVLETLQGAQGQAPVRIPCGEGDPEGTPKCHLPRTLSLTPLGSLTPKSKTPPP